MWSCVAVCYMLRVARRPLLVVRCSVFVVDWCSLSIVRYALFVVWCLVFLCVIQLSVACVYWLFGGLVCYRVVVCLVVAVPVCRCSLFVVRCVLSVGCYLVCVVCVVRCLLLFGVCCYLLCVCCSLCDVRCSLFDVWLPVSWM